MEPPPLPASARFRLRVEVVAPQDGRNVSAQPLCKFTIVKNGALPLPDLTLRQLSHEVVKRFGSMYPREPLFNVDRPQDSLGFDLHLDDRVRDVFADLDVLRVVQGETFRDSVEPHRARSASVQPYGLPIDRSLMGRKRLLDHSSIQPHTQPEKRQRTSNIDADRPIHSRERDGSADAWNGARENLQHDTVIQDSQASFLGHGQRYGSNEHVQIQSSHPVREVSDSEVSDSVRKIDGVYKDVQSLDGVTKTAAQPHHITSPLSAGSSKSGALTSGSDALHGLGPTTSSNRKLPFYDESNCVDRLKSPSTAATTPPFAELQHDINTQAPENRMLKRPNLGTAQDRDGVRKAPKVGSRLDLYDNIETDQERPRVKPIRSTGGKASSKPRQPSPPAGVSKFKALARKASSSGDGSPRPLRGNVDDGKDIGQQREAIRSRVDLKRMDQQHQEAANSTRQKAGEQYEAVEIAAEDERQAALRSLHLRDAKAKELEATVRRAAEAKAKAEDDAKNKAIEKAEEEARVKAVAASQAKAKSDRQHRIRLEMEANKKREEDELQVQKGNATWQTKPQKQQGVQTPYKPPNLRSNGMPSRAVAAHEKSITGEFDSEARASAPNSATSLPTPASKRASSTPFIPLGRPSGFVSAALLSSPAVGSLSSTEPTPKARVETPVPLPPDLKRKVSFADLQPQSQPRSAQKSVTPTSSLRQTTLVPPRLGITDVKSTPKHAMNRAASSGTDSSKSNKGKGKVVESPAKIPPQIIVISSDDESNAGYDAPVYVDLSGSEYHEDDFRDVGEPGPAYQKPSLRFSTSTKSKTQSSSLGAPGSLGKSQTTPDKIIKLERVSSPEGVFQSPAKSSSQMLRGRLGPRGLRSHAISYSPIRPPLASEASCSPEHQDASHSENASALVNDIINSVATGNSNAHGKDIREDEKREDEGSKRHEEQDSENVSETDDDEPAETDLNIKAATVAKHDYTVTKTAQNRAHRDIEEVDEVESDETGDDAESEAEDGVQDVTNRDDKIMQGTRMASINNPAEDDIASTGDESNMRTDTKSSEQNQLAETNDSTEEETDHDETSNEEESDEGGGGRAPHTLQIAVDNQLYSQAHQAISSRRKRIDMRTQRGRSTVIDDDAEQLRKLSARMPSLRRMTQEAERTKEADAFAARARGIAKAQKEKDDARQASEMEETEDSTDLGSSASEEDNDKAEAADLPKTHIDVNSGRKLSESSRSAGCLGSEDAEDVRRELLTKTSGRFGASPQTTIDPRTSQVNGGRRRVILPPLKKHTVGFASLAKKFSVANKKSPRG